MKSSIGQITVASTDKGLCALHIGRREDFKKWVDKNIKFANLTYYEAGNMHAVTQLQEYFTGRRKVFELDLDILTGTDFQRSVWAELMNIPYGETISYKELACMVRNKNYCRAVGQAVNKNPLPIIIPCHRVIGTDGNLTGYAGGIRIKMHLIEIERKNFIQQR